jgi:hypothetical protein
MKTFLWWKIKIAAFATATLVLGGALAVKGFSNNSQNTPGNLAQAEETILIVPGKSVGSIRKGMTTNEVEAVLGKPEKWQGKMMVYDSKLGMSVGQSRTGVLVVFCGDSMLRYPGVKKFKGRTKEGIGMESSRENVVKAFGQPTTTQPGNSNQETMKYKQLGLTFVLEAGKVINIIVDFRLPADDSAGASKGR